jgi:hypothetical protein
MPLVFFGYMSEENDALVSTNTATLTERDGRFAVHIVLDATKMNEERRDLLMGRALSTAGKVKHEVMAMEDADVLKAVALQRNRLAQQGFTNG